jgi:O-antigen/teichoic acid export membrane protein
VLNYLIPGVFFLTIFKVMNMDLAGKGKPWVSAKAMIPALLINVIMNFILIPKIGANGAAISSTLSYSFASLLFLYLYSRETGISISEIITFKKTDFTTIKNFLK